MAPGCHSGMAPKTDACRTSIPPLGSLKHVVGSTCGMVRQRRRHLRHIPGPGRQQGGSFVDLIGNDLVEGVGLAAPTRRGHARTYYATGEAPETYFRELPAVKAGVPGYLCVQKPAYYGQAHPSTRPDLPEFRPLSDHGMTIPGIVRRKLFGTNQDSSIYGGTLMI